MNEDGDEDEGGRERARSTIALEDVIPYVQGYGQDEGVDADQKYQPILSTVGHLTELQSSNFKASQNSVSESP